MKALFCLFTLGLGCFMFLFGNTGSEVEEDFIRDNYDRGES